ncbi:protein FLX-like 2 [Carica papaya]|uniref:protein FLX-like 2 n=1 Tax=Carica papaya TaxID=3649 RepID=UPI000B8CCD67|nr:protein FLX-like 2 [Carica papaya]
MSKVHQLSQDLPRARADIQQMPALISELENLRQEYQHCRATYDYEKKFYNDHLESLQAMEKNYITMAREVDKLRAELMNAANADRRAGGHYNDNEGPGHPSGHNAYEDGYSVPQVCHPPSDLFGLVLISIYILITFIWVKKMERKPVSFFLY